MRVRAAAALAAVALVAVAWSLGLTAGPERWTYDTRMQLRGAHPTDEVAVIAIDDRSINTLSRWPFRRRLHAQAIDRLHEAGARIVYDVQFTEQSPFPADDAALMRAVGRAPGTVLASGENDGHGNTKVFGNDKVVRQLGATAGAANLPAGPGGVIRRYDRDVDGLPTIAARVVPRAGGGLIDYRGPAGTIPTYSFVDLLDGKIPADQLRGRIVVVGATAPTLQDIHPTPAGGKRLTPGPEIQANAIWTALHGDPLHRAPAAIAYLVLLLLVGAAAWRAWAGVLLGVAYAGAAIAAFLAAGLVLPLAVPVIGAVVAVAAVVLARVVTETRARRAATRELAETQLEAVQRLARAAELRDNDTGDHIERMSELCERVALELGWSAVDALLLRQASALHDVGKIGLPDSILRKPGRLTDAEMAIMRRHTTEGAALLDGSRSPLLKLAEVIARTHHERWAGGGYPAGLAGEQIPVSGRIAAVCDVYDALTSARPYKQAWTVTAALEEIASQAGRHFEPDVAAALARVIERTRPADPGWRADVSTVEDDDAGRTDADRLRDPTAV